MLNKSNQNTSGRLLVTVEAYSSNIVLEKTLQYDFYT